MLLDEYDHEGQGAKLALNEISIKLFLIKIPFSKIPFFHIPNMTCSSRASIGLHGRKQKDRTKTLTKNSTKYNLKKYE